MLKIFLIFYGVLFVGVFVYNTFRLLHKKKEQIEHEERKEEE